MRFFTTIFTLPFCQIILSRGMLWAMDIYFAMLEIGMKQETPLVLANF